MRCTSMLMLADGALIGAIVFAGLICPPLGYLIGLGYSESRRYFEKKPQLVIAVLYAAIFILGVRLIDYIWPILLVAGPLGPFVGVAIFVTVARRPKVVSSRNCYSCKYDLTGNVSGIC